MDASVTPGHPNPGWLYAKRLKQVKTLLPEDIKAGDIDIDRPSNEMLARSIIHVRDASLRGVIARPDM